jgi:hypothetical protein
MLRLDPDFTEQPVVTLFGPRPQRKGIFSFPIDWDTAQFLPRLVNELDGNAAITRWSVLDIHVKISSRCTVCVDIPRASSSSHRSANLSFHRR